VRVLRQCGACGAEFENTKDPDRRVDAYATYRESKRLLTPERIREWRRSYELKQAEVTALLGWGEVTLGHYETGSLQTEAHDKQLADLMNPCHLVSAVETHPEMMSEDRRRAVLTQIRERLSPRSRSGQPHRLQ
jgi:DNA-binding transcriptional regulator YiaG